MKLTSRMKFALVQRLTVNIIFLSIMTGVYIFYISGEIRYFEDRKQEVSEKFEYHNRIEISGIDYGTMTRLLNETGKLRDRFLQSVVAQIDGQFYNEHFTNTTNERYTSFLAQKGREIDEIKSTEAFASRYQKLDTILPIYSPLLRLSSSDLSTADFINNVENLLYRFNLTHSGEIGIRNLNIVSMTENSGEQADNANTDMSENIFAIPVELNIEGMKGNVVNFIHYLSHVGSVSPDYENNSLIPHDDSFLGGQSEDLLFTDRYLGQIVSIEDIVLNEYLDSSATQSDEDFTSRIRSPSQFRERYNVRLAVNFYVAGYPQFRINESIENLLADLEEDLTNMDSALKRAEEAFDESNSEARANHRVAARAVSQIKESYNMHTNIELTGLGQEEVIEMYEDLQKIHNFKEVIQQRYNTFFQ